MRKLSSVVILSLIFTSLSLPGFSQENEKTGSVPKWISDKGYWIVESNIHTPKNSIIYFYNLTHQLLYKERIDGVKIKLNKKKVCMRLKNILEQCVASWERQQRVRENELLVSAALKK